MINEIRFEANILHSFWISNSITKCIAVYLFIKNAGTETELEYWEHIFVPISDQYLE